jgi:hypothetical protein
MIEALLLMIGPPVIGFIGGRMSKRTKQPELPPAPTGPRWKVKTNPNDAGTHIRVTLRDTRNTKKVKTGEEYNSYYGGRVNVYENQAVEILIAEVPIQSVYEPIWDADINSYRHQIVQDNGENLTDVIAVAQEKASELNAIEEVVNY